VIVKEFDIKIALYIYDTITKQREVS